MLIHHILLKKTDLVNLKSDADKLDIDKLKNIPNNLSNLQSEVDKLDIGKLETASVDLENEVIKKIEYNELLKRVNNISTIDNNDLVKKTAENFTIRLKQASLASKNYIANFVKKFPQIKQNMYWLKAN